MFRCLSKPFKRFFFSYADRVSDKWIKIVYHKYKIKYIKKLNKLGNSDIILNESIQPYQYYLVPGLIEYINVLENKLDNERGLAHSKVREYWLRRGPRLIIVLILTIFITIGLSELLIDRTMNDIIYSILVGINMIIFSIYMLYQRLIDSISGSMMRIGHDHYNNWKNNKSNIIINNNIKISFV